MCIVFQIEDLLKEADVGEDVTVDRALAEACRDALEDCEGDKARYLLFICCSRFIYMFSSPTKTMGHGFGCVHRPCICPMFVHLGLYLSRFLKSYSHT